MSLRIAVDGPAGSGKSALAEKLAERLGLLHLNTGMIYRAFTLRVLSAGALASESIVGMLPEFDVEIERGRVLMDGADVTEKLRAKEVERKVSPVAAIPQVRERVGQIQRKIIDRTEKIVVEGRDIGTVVMPDADIKVFLTASAEARARRRADTRPLGEVAEEIRKRDEEDQTKKHSPLRAAEDAVHIDNTNKTVEEVVEEICAILKIKQAFSF